MQINNNNNNIKQENKKLKLEEKNKSNNKILGYTGLCVVGVAAFGIAGKVIWDKLKKNDNNNPDQQQNKKKKTEVNIQENNLKGAPADNYNPNVKIIDKNYLMAFKQNDSYCFHNALLQLLACPEIRCKKYGLKNIDKMIGWINSVINKNNDTMSITNSLSTPVEVPEDVRLQPEVQFNNPITREKIDLSDAPKFDLKSRDVVKQGAFDSSKGNAICFDIHAIVESLQYKKISGFFPNVVNGDYYGPGSEVYLLDLGFTKVYNSAWLKGIDDVFKLAGACPDVVENKIEGFIVDILGMCGNNGDNAGSNAIKVCKKIAYYPTFGTALMGGHYYHFYLIYDDQQNIKKVLWNAGSGFCLMKEKDFNKVFEKGHVYVKFSNKEIVKKYYTE